MTAVAVAGRTGIELEQPGRLVALEAEVLGIILARADPEGLRPLLRRRQQIPECWHRVVVQVRRGRPGRDERPSAVLIGHTPLERVRDRTVSLARDCLQGVRQRYVEGLIVDWPRKI